MFRKQNITYPDGDALVVCSRGEFDDELGSSPLLGIIERAEPADDPDTVLAGRRLLLLGHGGGSGDGEENGGVVVQPPAGSRDPPRSA